jgi:release factor glutamine methyltransferase
LIYFPCFRKGVFIHLPLESSLKIVREESQQLKTVFEKGVALLRSEGIPEPELEVALLLSHILHVNRTGLLLSGERPLPAEQCAAFSELIGRRLDREPLAYITGEKEFWSLPFSVTKDVLIPRPETELLVARALQAIKEPARTTQKTRILDLGTGSGIIAIVLGLEVQTARITAVDRSFRALQVALHNAKKHKVAERIDFVNSDWTAGLSINAPFDFIVANPPYVAEAILAVPAGSAPGSLQPEVLRFEPRLALDGGQQGLDAVRKIAVEVSRALKPDGWLFMEIGADQGQVVPAVFAEMDAYDSLAVHNDYAGLPRVFQARVKEGRPTKEA